jgi:nicotinamide-nucleotide adenylyltransferase
MTETVNSIFRRTARMILPTASVISSAIERVQQQAVSAALVYTTHERWPLLSTQSSSKRPLRISILDSSFNPPTLAHLALANAPNPFSVASDYDAKLLLLSVRNADKSLQEDDASLSQRVEMMSLLSLDIHHNGLDSPPNVAVGLVNEPTFPAKSSALRNFLDGHLATLIPDPSHALSFTFLMGPSHYTRHIHLAQTIWVHLVLSRL